MPSTSQELSDKMHKVVRDYYDNLVKVNNPPADSPWRDVAVGHGEIREYCEDLLKDDGFILPNGGPCHGYIIEPDKYEESMLPENIWDAVIYLVEEWDFFLGKCEDED